MLINVFNLIVSKLNELVVDDHKRTAKKYLDIPFNTALLESSYSVKTTNDSSTWVLSMHERETKQVETADNDSDDERIEDQFKDKV